MKDRREFTRESMATTGQVDDAHYRVMCEHAGIALISSDVDLNVRTWNSAAARMFGAEAAVMIGVPLSSVIPIEDRKKGAELLHESLSTGQISSFEFKDHDEEGRLRYLIATFSPIIDDDGLHTGVSACVRDITRRIALETELAHRTKMSSLGQMAGALAHHFNNILAATVTSVDFALGAGDSDFQVRVLRQTGDTLAKASKLTEALLKFAEGDVKHQDESDLTEVLIDVTGEMELELAKINVQLDIELNPIPVTPVPRDQIVTVMQNLLRNAADAMPDGGTVTVASKVIDGVVCLVVSDTGCGMDESVLQRVFEPFYSTKTSGLNFEQHPGLGLAVAHGLLQVLGHTISVESEVDKGTRIEIRFTGESAKFK